MSLYHWFRNYIRYVFVRFVKFCWKSAHRISRDFTVHQFLRDSTPIGRSVEQTGCMSLKIMETRGKLIENKNDRNDTRVICRSAIKAWVTRQQVSRSVKTRARWIDRRPSTVSWSPIVRRNLWDIFRIFASLTRAFSLIYSPAWNAQRGDLGDIRRTRDPTKRSRRQSVVKLQVPRRSIAKLIPVYGMHPADAYDWKKMEK